MKKLTNLEYATRKAHLAFRAKERVIELFTYLDRDNWVDTSWHNDEEDSVWNEEESTTIYVLEKGGYSIVIDTSAEDRIYLNDVSTLEELFLQLDVVTELTKNN